MTVIKIARELPQGLPSERDDPDNGVEWWIVEVAGYGITAMPSLELAQNGADQLRAGRQKVTKVRKARFDQTGDQLAIVACISELQEEMMLAAIRLTK